MESTKQRNAERLLNFPDYWQVIILPTSQRIADGFGKSRAVTPTPTLARHALVFEYQTIYL